jgi:hypothetical protein
MRESAECWKDGGRRIRPAVENLPEDNALPIIRRHMPRDRAFGEVILNNKRGTTFIPGTPGGVAGIEFYK